MMFLKDRFKRQLFAYLNKVVIRHSTHGMLYPLFESVDTEDFLFGTIQISISFRLRPERPPSGVSLEELEARPPEEEEGADVVCLPSMGEMVLLYTFNSIGGIDRNRRDFEQFAVQTYLSPEQIRADDVARIEKIQGMSRPIEKE